MLGKYNVLKFENKVVLNLDECEANIDVIEVGKHKFTLRDFKLQDGHDDSLPYSAVLCDNGKPLCNCLNDGWGGMTELKPVSVQSGAIMVSIKKALANFKWSFKGTIFDVTLDWVADTLAIGENIKLNKTIKGRIS